MKPWHWELLGTLGSHRPIVCDPPTDEHGAGFRDSVGQGDFNDDDGYGFFADATRQSTIQFSPSNFEKRLAKLEAREATKGLFTHVVWLNR